MTTVPAASSSSSTSSSSTSPHYAHPASSTIDLLSPSSTSPSAAPTGTIGASSCGAVDLLTAPAQHQPPPPPLLQQEQSPHPQGKSRPLSRSNTVSKTVGSTEKSPEALISVTASKPSPAVSPAPLEQPSPVFSTSANTPQAAVTLAASSSSTPSTPTSASTPSTTANPSAAFLLRVSVPSIGMQKTIRALNADTVWNVKRQISQKVGNDHRDVFNFGIYLPPTGGRLGKYLDERREIGTYQLENNCQVEYVSKKRLNSSPSDGESLPTPKNQKKFLDDVTRGLADKVRERGSKGMDPNFQGDGGETPLSVAVMNNDKDMILVLIEAGALLDFRVGEKDGWKTPLHIAAAHNKLVALQLLLSCGAWVNAPDQLNLTPLYYAATGGYAECVEKLLLMKADTEVYDESGKGPLHQACLHKSDQAVSLLVDFGATIDAPNALGNTPLHIAATRNAVDCAKWLLMRGANSSAINKNGLTPENIAAQSFCTEVLEILRTHSPDHIVPLPPKMEDLEKSTPRKNVVFHSVPRRPQEVERPERYRSQSEIAKSHHELSLSHGRSVSDIASSKMHRQAAAQANIHQPHTHLPRSTSRQGSQASDVGSEEGLARSATASSHAVGATLGKLPPSRKIVIPGPPPTPRPSNAPLPSSGRSSSRKSWPPNSSFVEESRASQADVPNASAPYSCSDSRRREILSQLERVKELVAKGGDGAAVLAELEALSHVFTSSIP